MASRIFSRKIKLPGSAAEAFTWHKQKNVFLRLLPPWEKISVLRHDGSITEGSRAKLHCQFFGPFGFTWQLEHQNYVPGQQFSDVQITGPFSSYKHLHLFTEDKNGAALEDRIEYSLPFPLLFDLFAPWLIEKRLSRTFAYRHRVTHQDLSTHAIFQGRPKLKFLISGASGMIGSALNAFLSAAGHGVTKIVRSAAQAEPGDIILDSSGQINLDPALNFDCVINLAGAGIADRRWSNSRKRELIESRVKFTESLVSALSGLSRAPKTFISASGIGFYGNTNDACPDESQSQGKGFLAELASQWEQAASAISSVGSRVIFLRLGSVLSASGGALQKMILPFTLGLGGTIGKGSQQFGWVSLDDVLRAVLFLAYEESIEGPVNMVSPLETSSREFTTALADALGRPNFFPLPSSVLKVIFGELAEETLLADSTAFPKKLLAAGFRFLSPTPKGAIEAALGLNSKISVLPTSQ